MTLDYTDPLGAMKIKDVPTPDPRDAEIERLRADNERLRDCIERAGRCLVMSNNGSAEALAILREAKGTTVQPSVAPMRHSDALARIADMDCEGDRQGFKCDGACPVCIANAALLATDPTDVGL